MLSQVDLLMEETPDEPADLLETIPEIRHLVHDRGEEAGLRSILQRPEALSKAWRQHLRAA